MGTQGHVKMPFEIFEEVKDGPNGDSDSLFAWLQQARVKSALLLADTVDPGLVQEVIIKGYANDLTDYELELVGRDPFLIAYALASRDRHVVTVETSEPKKQRQNRKIPDVCKTMGAACFNPFQFNRALGFSTNWNQKL